MFVKHSHGEILQPLVLFALISDLLPFRPIPHSQLLQINDHVGYMIGLFIQYGRGTPKEQDGLLVVLRFNTTLKAKVICVSRLSHTNTNTNFFPKPPTTFLTCFSKGERRKYARKKFRLNRVSTSQPPGHESDTLTTEQPGWGPEEKECDSFGVIQTQNYLNKIFTSSSS